MKSTMNQKRWGTITIKTKLWLAVAITSAGMVFAGALGVLGMQTAVSTVRYLGVEVDDALEISEQTEI